MIPIQTDDYIKADVVNNYSGIGIVENAVYICPCCGKEIEPILLLKKEKK